LDINDERIDRETRPELTFGTYDIKAGSEYFLEISFLLS
jgi:hypothetical protein